MTKLSGDHAIRWLAAGRDISTGPETEREFAIADGLPAIKLTSPQKQLSIRVVSRVRQRTYVIRDDLQRLDRRRSTFVPVNAHDEGIIDLHPGNTDNAAKIAVDQDIIVIVRQLAGQARTTLPGVRGARVGHDERVSAPVVYTHTIRIDSARNAHIEHNAVRRDRFNSSVLITSNERRRRIACEHPIVRQVGISRPDLICADNSEAVLVDKITESIEPRLRLPDRLLAGGNPRCQMLPPTVPVIVVRSGNSIRVCHVASERKRYAIGGTAISCSGALS